ncbi:MAG TPA: hypothetical protein ENJ32_08340 [Crenotrichaceae bacterium]|nr:hypothetical protein [Crenotrichaceae bacterium]
MAGIRFKELNIPQRAVITSAFIQLQVDKVQSEATSLRTMVDDKDNALAFPILSVIFPIDQMRALYPEILRHGQQVVQQRRISKLLILLLSFRSLLTGRLGEWSFNCVSDQWYWSSCS